MAEKDLDEFPIPPRLMPGHRAPQARATSERTRRATASRPTLTLLVYHTGADVTRQLARLRRSGRFTLKCVAQRAGPLDIDTVAADGVLWELDRRSRPDPRRVGLAVHRLPVVSFAAGDGGDLGAMSRRAGFRGHLLAPLDPLAVEREMGTAAAGAVVMRVRGFLSDIGSPGGRAQVLEAVVRATATTRTPNRMSGHIVDLAFDWFGGDAWAVVAADERRGMYRLAERGVTASVRAAMTALAERAVRSGTVIWEAAAAPTGHRRGRGRMAAVAFPLRSHGRAVAALVGLDGRAGDEEAASGVSRAALAPLLALLDGLAGPLDVAMRLKRATTLSSVDDLTGLYNSRFLNGTLRREVKRAVRTKRPLSLLFVDLDGFKGINDRHGHLCGGRALVEAAGRIRSGARETDIVARFGGDEFALVLPETGRSGAMLVARRIRERVAGHPFLAGEGISYRLTASVGAATLPDSAASPEALLAAADAAMYRVKGRGKDGIEMAITTAARRR